MHELDSLRAELKELERQFTEADVEAAAKKTAVNGSFGKLGSKWSAIYSPDLMIQVTVTGQLALLMLIESIELAGISVVSGNTDGVVIKCPKSKEPELQRIIAEWEAATGFNTEETRYAALYSRDVNSYVAIKTNGEVKTKGDLAPSDAQHNPSEEIVKRAVVDYLCKGASVIETITKCTDIRDFLSVQRVTGGAQIPISKKPVDTWYQCDGYWELEWRGKIHKAKRKSRPAALLLTDEARYLGNVVRFYISTKSADYIEYVKNGNKVPRSDNAMPLMELDGSFPDDIDYFHYIRTAYKLLEDLGCSAT